MRLTHKESGGDHARMRGLGMCDRCIEIDATIERYRRISGGVTDQPTLDAIKKLSEQLKAEKATLHPEQQR